MCDFLCCQLLYTIIYGFYFYTQIIDNKFLTSRGIFTHIILQNLLNRHLFGKDNRLQLNIFADKGTEFVGRNLA